ncbi:MAG TPA: DnaJ domain-containing protein [Nitrospiraceae bacterium]|nr:DnaJ domain-containing protein [Nitrospiraceae bacterium]
MLRHDYYLTLNVPRDASDEEIKKAYRKLVFEYHPDRNPDSREAEAKIREINAAYEVVGNPETRKTYDRLTFGDEIMAETPDLGVVLQQMEDKLFDEGRKELLAALMKNVPRIKSELAEIRVRTVEAQGYDSFKESIVLQRAAQVLPELLTPDMETRQKRLLDVAVQMMISQHVVGKDDQKGINTMRDRFAEIFRRGQLGGFQSALELFYVRR